MNGCSRQNVNLILREQSDGIGNLDHKIQNLIVGVSDKRNTFDELKDLIIAENASSKEYISQELQKVRSYGDSSFSIYIAQIHQIFLEVTILASSLSFATPAGHPEKSC